ncbi:hypothetical protein ACNSO7_26780 [Yersinia enterocolitica]|uniref:hypothetical protein n=1 Tax=Yersinia enterocolitica TaxID=630 RepID=UPI003AB81085
MFTQSNTPALESREAGGLSSARKNTFAVWALTRRWDALKDYAETLDEAALIFRAID